MINLPEKAREAVELLAMQQVPSALGLYVITNIANSEAASWYEAIRRWDAQYPEYAGAIFIHDVALAMNGMSVPSSMALTARRTDIDLSPVLHLHMMLHTEPKWFALLDPWQQDYYQKLWRGEYKGVQVPTLEMVERQRFLARQTVKEAQRVGH